MRRFSGVGKGKKNKKKPKCRGCGVLGRGGGGDRPSVQLQLHRKGCAGPLLIGELALN